MAIVKMKKLKLTAVRSQRDVLLERLLMLDCVEVSEPDSLLVDEELALAVSRETSELEQFKANHTSLLRAAELMKRYAPTKTKMFAPRREVVAEEFFNADTLRSALELADRMEMLDARLHRIAAEETRELSVIESLMPWDELSLPLNYAGTRTCAMVIGSVPITADFFALEKSLTNVACAQVIKVSENKDQLCVTVIYMRDEQTPVYDALREYGFSESSLKNTSGTARENIAVSKDRVAALDAERESIKTELAASGERRDELQMSIDLVATMIQQAQAQERFVATESTITLTGWFPAENEADVDATLGQLDCVYEFSEPVEDEYPDVPIRLKNNAVTAPLSMVTEMYSLPSYDGVDPNPVMMPFFVLFYGFMMADMGYGLIMMIASLIIKRKKPRGGAKQLFDLMFMCGITTLIFGVVTGGFFGDAIQQVASMYGKTFTLPYTPLLNPVDDAMNVLIFAMALGFVHIIAGMAVDLVHKIKSGNALGGVMDVIPWWITFAGIGLGALGITWYVALAGALLLVATQGREKPSIVGKITSGLGSLYNITAYFGDVLSYARLMALMLAGGVVASVFNSIGAMTGNIVVFLIIFAIGHGLNIGLNLLGCYVHDLRLQCLEFFGKFYSDGGKAFRPLGINGKYTQISK